MRPANLPMSFELGTDEAADFAVSVNLPLTAAIVTFRRKGEAAAALTKACTIGAGNVAQLRLTPADLATLGAGAHSYQLDIQSNGQTYRIAKGSATVAYGVTSVFS